MKPEHEICRIDNENIPELILDVCQGYNMHEEPKFVRDIIQKFRKIFSEHYHKREDAYYLAEEEFMKFVKEVQEDVADFVMMELTKSDMVEMSVDSNGEILFSLNEKGRKHFGNNPPITSEESDSKDEKS